MRWNAIMEDSLKAKSQTSQRPSQVEDAEQITEKPERGSERGAEGPTSSPERRYQKLLHERDQEIARLQKINYKQSKLKKPRSYRLRPGESKMIVNKMITRQSSPRNQEGGGSGRKDSPSHYKKRYMRVNFHNNSSQEQIVIRDVHSSSADTTEKDSTSPVDYKVNTYHQQDRSGKVSLKRLRLSNENPIDLAVINEENVEPHEEAQQEPRSSSYLKKADAACQTQPFNDQLIQTSLESGYGGHRIINRQGSSLL